jgi:hypothetical protein
MIIHSGDDLGFPRLPGDRVHQHHPADDVDLPQLHRPRPLEPHKRLPRPLPRPRQGQPMPQQDPVDRRSDGTTNPSDGARNSCIRIRFDPHRGCLRRSSATNTSTCVAA